MRPPYKIMLQALIPVIIIASVITLFTNYHSQRLTKDEIAAFENSLLDAKKTVLRSYISLAQASIRNADLSPGAHGLTGPPDKPTRDEAIRILATLATEPDADFFVYDFGGNNYVHPRQPGQVGKNQLELKDSNGVPVVRNFLRRARNGGGFERHAWKNAESGKMTDRLSYVVALEDWQWVLGASVNLADVNQLIQATDVETAARFRQNSIVIGGLTVKAVIIIVVTGIFFGLHERREADTKLKELTQRIVETQEEERGRVARELHDGISQVLVSVKYSLELARLRAEQKSDDVGDAIDKGAEGLNSAIREVRRISRDLRPHMLDDLGLSPALESLAGEFSERTGIDVKISTTPFRRSLPTDAKTTLFRVAQEALTNIERHAGAANTKIELGLTRRGVELKITDDGKGFETSRYEGNQHSTGGLGLRNMKERLAYHNGEFNVVSTANGTTIYARLPRSLLRSDADGKPAEIYQHETEEAWRDSTKPA